MSSLQEEEWRVRLDEGWTPLIDAPNAAKAIGSERLLVKDEGRKPSGSFADCSAFRIISWHLKQRAAGKRVEADGECLGLRIAQDFDLGAIDGTQQAAGIVMTRHLVADNLNHGCLGAPRRWRSAGAAPANRTSPTSSKAMTGRQRKTHSWTAITSTREVVSSSPSERTAA
jgi:hypothetical protein